MKLPFGYELNLRRKSLSPPDSGRWVTIQDPYPGAWQQDNSIELNSVLGFSAVFACVRLITSDIGKMRILLMERTGNIWRETESAAFSPVLRKPNEVQTRIKFIEQWLTSKLLHGNAYILKQRDNRDVVNKLRVLNPERVDVLVAETGEVFYKLRQDRMTQIGPPEIVLPATEIIHDVHVTPDHPLVGVSPITACGLTAAQGLNIQNSSEAFFRNRALPSGMLTAPGAISKDTAERLKADFQQKYSGANMGKVAVAGDGLKFEAFTMSAVDAQLIEQLKWTAEDVCRAFGVPGYKVGVGQMPATGMAALNQQYYDDTLQELIVQIEALLFEGLEMPTRYRPQFDLEDLLRMDKSSRFDAYDKAIGAGWKAPNEVREAEGLPPVEGGDAPYLQQQNYSLAALAKRDAMNPLADPGPNPGGETPPPPPIQEDPPADQQRHILRSLIVEKEMNRRAA
jgi:HK97 family phage portal protein